MARASLLLPPQKSPVIEVLKISTLMPYARNARTHSKEQIAKLAASIAEFGFTSPILIDADGMILAGHGRAIAAREAGLDEIPCIRLSHLTPEQARAYILADNRIALDAGWDKDLLSLELGDLHAAGVDVGALGFSPGELADLFLGDEEPEITGEKKSKETAHTCPSCGHSFKD